MSMISIVNKEYLEKDSIRKLVTYCLGDRNLQKKNYEVKWAGTGVMLHNPKEVVKSMMDMKVLHERTKGNQLCHIILNIFCKETNYAYGYAMEPEFAMEMADDVSALLYRMGYQNCYFVHTDSNFPHVHFVINSLKPTTRQIIYGYPWFMDELLRFLVFNYGFLDWEKGIHTVDVLEGGALNENE